MDVSLPSEQIQYFGSLIQNVVDMMNRCVDVIYQKIESLKEVEVKDVQNNVSRCVKANLINGEEIIQTKKNQKKIIEKIEKLENQLDKTDHIEALEENFSQFKNEVEISLEKTQKSNEKMWEVVDTTDRRISFLDFQLNDSLDDLNNKLNYASDNIAALEKQIEILQRARNQDRAERDQTTEILLKEIQHLKAFMKITYEKKCMEVEAKDDIIEQLNQELLEFKDCYYHL